MGGVVQANAERRADAALLMVAMIWGTTFTLVGAAMNSTSPLLFLVLRFGIASLLLGPFLLRSAWPRGVWVHGLGLGAVGFVGFWFQTAGLRWTTPSRSAFITGLSVVLVPLLSVALLRRRPSNRALFGALLAALGLGVLTRPELGGWNRGDLLTLGCAIAWAVYILWVHYASRVAGVRGLRSLVFLQMSGTFLLSLAALPLEPWRLGWGPDLWLALAVTAPLATTLTYFLQNWAQARTTPTRASVILTMEPVFAALFAWTWGVEILGPWTLAGGALIVTGMLVVEIRRTGR